MDKVAEQLDWQQYNKDCLTAALKEVRQNLLDYIAVQKEGLQKPSKLSQRKQKSDTTTKDHSVLAELCHGFNLSSFERKLLLLCAGMELDGQFAKYCAEAHGDPGRAYPTFGLALSIFKEAHWSALTPNAALRHWQLIEIGNGVSLNLSPLKITESVLHYLVGVGHMDYRLTALLRPIRPTAEVIASQQALIQHIIRIWSPTKTAHELAIINLVGADTISQQQIALAVCQEMQWNLYAIDAKTLPTDIKELESLQLLLTREALFNRSMYFLTCEDSQVNEKIWQAVNYLTARLAAHCFIGSLKNITISQKTQIKFEIKPATTTEQIQVWQKTLTTHIPKGLEISNKQLEKLTSQFRLTAGQIHNIGIKLACKVDKVKQTDGIEHQLWSLCREQAHQEVEHFIRVIKPQASWEELTLPDQQIDLLKTLMVQVKQRYQVYENWQFAKKSSRGLGICALFAGPSGTGKTLAAEVLAAALNLDLFCIDLSAVVSKYIGETEKNLEKVFTAAERCGAVLLFDEADALFSKRNDVNSSNDRYANMEVSYLLQRMEAYQGLSLLTTNLKSNIDEAFIRRLRFIVQFSYPNKQQRAEIWQRVFPKATPTESLDIDQLAELNLTGGNIQSIALNAAFIAAEAEESVTMQYIMQAARDEYIKLEKPFVGTDGVGSRIC